MVFERAGKGGARLLPFEEEVLNAKELSSSLFVSRGTTLDPIEFSLTPNAAPAGPVDSSESFDPTAVLAPVVADLTRPMDVFVEVDNGAAGVLMVLDGSGKG